VLGDAYATSAVSHFLERRIRKQRIRLLTSDPYLSTIRQGETDRKPSECRSNCLDYSTRMADEVLEMSRLMEEDDPLTVSRRRSFDDSVISWREQAILERMYAKVKLNKVVHV
jgi:hypothetical protein